jgi:hypothetical protein
MKITREISLTYEYKNGTVIFDDLRALCFALGTTSIPGNYHVYGVDKRNNRYYVPVEEIRKRLNKKKRQIEKIQEYIDVMQQLVNSIDKIEKKEEKE